MKKRVLLSAVLAIAMFFSGLSVPLEQPLAAVAKTSLDAGTVSVNTILKNTKTIKTLSASNTSPGKAKTKYQKMIALKKKYPEGTPWDNDNVYEWHAFESDGIIYEMHGCAAFAAILSDAAFGKNAKTKQINKPKASKVKVGDILRINDDTHSVIVLKVKKDHWVIAEGNYNSSVHWNRKLPKDTIIDYLYRRK
ncbi:MAG: hypothetical protein J6P16_04690 [Eubacterium sp.]|nr:hypothetical protein [Eubacterium sp.]